MDIQAPIDQPLTDQVKIAPRKGWIALLLSLIWTGLGHFYNGRPVAAAIIFVGQFFILGLMGWTRMVTTYWGLWLAFTIFLLYRLITAFSAYFLARKQQEYVLKSYNRWYYNLTVIVGLEFIFFFTIEAKNILGVESFRLPTPSNEPTLLIGDCVMADIWYYKNHQPNYGDIALYKREGSVYVHRIVGLPGDVISFEDDIVVINGKKCKARTIGSTHLDGFPWPANIENEILPNGHAHELYTIPQVWEQPAAQFPAYKIPGGMVFVAGDNRSNSLDSRYIGPINIEELIGRMSYVYWGIETERMGIDLHEN